MGRTNPTFRDALRAVEDRWQQYRRALRSRDQPRFDQLFTYVRNHADASGFLNHRNPLIPMLVSIDLEQERRLDEHDERLEELEATITTLAHRDEISDPADAKAAANGHSIPDGADSGTRIDGAELPHQSDTEPAAPPRADRE